MSFYPIFPPPISIIDVKSQWSTNEYGIYYNLGNVGIGMESTSSYVLNILGDTLSTGMNNIYGALNVTGNLDLTGQVDISGNTNITGQLDVIGDTHITGQVDISGNTNITGKVDVIGDTHITGQVDVSGNTNITGQLDVYGNIIVDGSYIQFSDGTQQTTAMVTLTADQTYTNATITTNSNGAISSISTNPSTSTIPFAYYYNDLIDASNVIVTLNFPNISCNLTDYILLTLNYQVASEYGEQTAISGNPSLYNITGSASCQLQIFPARFSQNAGINTQILNINGSYYCNIIFTNQYNYPSSPGNGYNVVVDSVCPNGRITYSNNIVVTNEVNTSAIINYCLSAYCNDDASISFVLSPMIGSTLTYPYQASLSIQIISNLSNCTVEANSTNTWTSANF